MDPTDEATKKSEFFDRFRKSWFPPAAALGAFSAFVAAAFRVRPEPPTRPQPPSGSAAAGSPLVQIDLSRQQAKALPRQYVQSSVLADGAFRRSLAGIAIGPADRIHVLGDDELKVFDAKGSLIRQWRVDKDAACVAIGPEEKVFVGAGERIDVYAAGGSHLSRIRLAGPGQPVNVTAVKIFRTDLLVADAAGRIIRLYDISGKPLGTIGDKNKTGNFILPNRSLDIAVDAAGIVYATDSGRHQVTSWRIDGTPVRKFGKFGMRDPEDFVGCCNPVNLALTHDGKVVTAEKMVARVKVYEPGGSLLAVIGPEHFDQTCIHIHLAVDAAGRIHAADPVRRVVKVFSAGV